jgi:hypothetical protein
MYTYHTFSSPAELIDFLNGTIVGRPLPQLVFGLHGLTLVVNDGLADRTVTFSDPSGLGLSPFVILAQVQVVHANLANVKLRSYCLSPQNWQLVLDAQGYTVKAGTANVILGWPATTKVVSQIARTDVIHVITSIASGPKYAVIINSDQVTAEELAVSFPAGWDMSTAGRTPWYRIDRKNVSAQITWPGTPSGTFAIEVTDNPTDATGDAIPDEYLEGMAANQPSGSAGRLFVDDIETDALYIAGTYTPAPGGSGVGAVPTMLFVIKR